MTDRTTRNSIPQDGFDCIYLYENGREVGCLNGPQSDPDVIARAEHWSRAAARPDAGCAVKARPVEVKQVHKLRHLLNHMPDKDFKLRRDEAAELLRYIDVLIEQPATPGYAAGFEACREALTQALLQIEYLHGRLGETTSSGTTVITKINAVLSALPAPAPAAEEVTVEQIDRLFDDHILIVPLDIDPTEYVIPRYSREAFSRALLSRFHITPKTETKP